MLRNTCARISLHSCGDVASNAAPWKPNLRSSSDTDAGMLTGSDAQQATDAALAAVPGATVIRVETDSDAGGTYEVHLTKADGTVATVKLDASFQVPILYSLKTHGYIPLRH